MGRGHKPFPYGHPPRPPLGALLLPLLLISLGTTMIVVYLVDTKGQEMKVNRSNERGDAEIVGMAVVVILILVGGFWMYTSYRKAACSTFSRESHRETKFVDYGFGNYDCLTLDNNGTWISTYSLRGE